MRRVGDGLNAGSAGAARDAVGLPRSGIAYWRVLSMLHAVAYVMQQIAAASSYNVFTCKDNLIDGFCLKWSNIIWLNVEQMLYVS